MKVKNIGVITSPFLLKAGVVPLSNLVNILSFFSDDVHIISGNAGIEISVKDNIHIYMVERNQEKISIIKILKYLRANLKISYKLSSLSNVNIWVFFMGERPLVIPLLMAKLLRKKVIFISSGMIKFIGKKNLFDIIVAHILEPINHLLSDKIIVYSNIFIGDDMGKLKNKISVAHEHFLDFGKFKINKRINERENLVGYIGRFSEEKGVINFVNAIPEILKENNNIKILIAGDGPLLGKIKKKIKDLNRNIADRVAIMNWIPHDHLPTYLNELKLIVIPSYTEGLPNIMLEALACGTPILATSVGLIPDIIKDSETGFILENNSHENISRNVLKIVSYDNLNEIINNGRHLVENEFTYDAALKNYKDILKL